MEATQPTQPTQIPSTRRARRRRWVTAAALLLVLLLLLAASVGSGSPTGAAPRGSGTSDDVDRQRADADDREAGEEPLDGTDNSDEAGGHVDLSDGNADDEPGDGVFDPDGDPVDPCGIHVAGDGDLLIVPDPLVLPDGKYDGLVHIRNCGDAVVEWTAATKPTVTLHAAGGTLAPGELTALSFTIQKSVWEPGAIEFKIKVSQPGFNEYVDVHAYRPLTGADMVGSTDLAIGPHLGGCADQCITKAWITKNLSSPDVSLEVGTSVLANVRVYLSKNPPVINPAGNPVFPGKPPKAMSPGAVQSWTTPLSNLQPTTKYYIIVKATDVDGDAAYRSGSFRTVTPIDGPDQLAPQDLEPGCAYQCITKAVITPGDGLAPAHLSVTTHTPARFQLALSTWDVFYEDGVPMFGNNAASKESGLEYKEGWEVDIAGLQPNTTYNGILRATDANGKIQYALGSFTTDGVDVVITIHKVHLTQDGDSQDWNRGELRFAWGLDTDVTVGMQSEGKHHPGDEMNFGDYGTYTLHDATGPLPAVLVNAYERDADGLSEFCPHGFGAMAFPGYSNACDTKGNVATSDHVTVAGLSSLDDCEDFGIDGEFADDACTVLEAEDHGNDYAEFWAIVSYTVID